MFLEDAHKVIKSTDNMEAPDTIKYLKGFTAKELVSIATDLKIECHPRSSKTVALQKVYQYIKTQKQKEMQTN